MNGAQKGQQWADLIYPIMLKYNNKLLHSAKGLTPKAGSKQENELNANVNLNLKAKRSRKYPAIS